ncbi:MAG TPA: serine/threonine-protein kinase [Myxococcaceae bacterium]|jgi:tetratricopeptide (TPR) repeat protein
MCPSDEEFAALIAGDLGGEKIKQIHAHAETCRDCRRALVGLASGQPVTASLEEEPAPDPAPLPGPLVAGTAVGRYSILAHVASGGMGAVYSAYDPQLDRRVALKVMRVRSGSPLDIEDRQVRLLREAQVLAQLSHPNVVAVHDAGTFEGQVFVAMEFVEGTTLRQWLEAEPRTWQAIRRVCVQAGRGLAAAHQAGLVHRDFKPDNVLIGRDGRVRVADFGLARPADGARPDESSGPSSPPVSPAPPPAAGSLLSPLTEEGAVLGTPRYMPPEQMRAEPLDPRADQFSFALVMYEAVYKVDAFHGRRLKYRLRQIEAGELNPPPSGRTAPDWLAAALRRALAADPGQRFPSMDALLDALEPDARRARLRARVIAGGAVAAALAGVAVLALGPARRCRGGEELLEGAWDAARRGAVHRSLELANVGAGGGRAEAALDRYASDWVAMRQEACIAARVRRDQTEAELELRTACLDRGLTELRYLTDLLAAADEKLAGRAVDAALGLPPVAFCADLAALRERVPPPAGAAERAAVAELSRRLAEVDALRLAGRWAEGLEKAKAAMPEAVRLGYRPMEAEALYLQGAMEGASGEAAQGWDHLVAAVNAAEAGHDDRLKVEVASQLVFLAGESARFDAGREWARAAEAMLERAGRNARQEGALLTSLGTLELDQGRMEAARASYERAVRLLDGSVGREHPLYLGALSNLATATEATGHPAQALHLLEEAIPLIARLRGPEHPQVAAALWSVAKCQLSLRQLAQAHQTLDRALEIARARLGPQHPRIAGYLDLRATIFQAQGNWSEAIVAYRQSLEIRTKSGPPMDPDLFWPHDGIGQCLLALGRPQEAVPELEAAMAIPGDPSPDRAETEYALARVLWALGRERSRALVLGRAARDHFAAAQKPDRERDVSGWLAALK